MKTTITQNTFIDTFRRSDTYKNNFTYEGLTALFEYFEELEEQLDEEIDFDMVAICCDFTEYPSAIDAVNDHTEDAPYLLDEDEADWLDLMELSKAQEEKALEWLQDNTQVITFDTGIIIQDF